MLLPEIEPQPTLATPSLIRTAIFEDRDEKRELIVAGITDIAEIALDIRSYGAGKKHIPLLGSLGIEALIMDGSLKKGNSSEPIRHGELLALEAKELYGDDITVIGISMGREVLGADYNWDCSVQSLRSLLAAIKQGA